MGRKIRVLVVDDSAFMCKWLSSMINAAPDCVVAGTARNGVEALKAVQKLRPDVVTMDIELPEIDGLTCVAYIMEDFPTPVVMVTGFSKFLGEETIRALEYGAVGLVRKPKRMDSRIMEEIREDLLSNIRNASQVDAGKLKPVTVKERGGHVKKPALKTTNRVTVVAASSGGPRALSQVIPCLPADIGCAVLVVQHIPDEFVNSLAERLDHESILGVRVAGDRDPVRRGEVLVMPAGRDCTISGGGNGGERVELGPLYQKKRYPLVQVDSLMTSAADTYGKNTTGVLLTGMGNDGTEGFRRIKEYGGYTIAEDESTCAVFGMPKSAIEADLVDRVLPLHEIAAEIVRTSGRGRPEGGPFTGNGEEP